MEDSMDSYGVAARNCDEQEETSTLRPRATETNPTEWTDEKHNLYLKSMEATFVNQLNKSLNLHVRKNCQSGSKWAKHKHSNIYAPSSQFKVLRDGRWSKTDFREEEEAEASQEESLLANPWVQHYRCSERQAIRKVLTSRAKDPSANFRLWRQDSVGSNAEVTDQNFNEEDLEDQSSRVHKIKRTRTSVGGRVPCNDQVVHFEIMVQGDGDAAEDRAHPED